MKRRRRRRRGKAGLESDSVARLLVLGSVCFFLCLISSRPSPALAA